MSYGATGKNRNRVHPNISRTFTGLNDFNRKILEVSNAYSKGESKTEDFIKRYVKKHGNDRTDAFGEIDFGTSTSKTAKYVKVASNINVEILYQLLTKHWNVKIPNLVISVTGGAKNFTLRTRLKEVFRKSLIKASENTGAWIITGGTHVGVMKHVGKAVKHYAAIRDDVDRVVTIGVAPWGVIYGRHQLENHPMHDQTLPKQYDADEREQEKSVVLDYNHSHFILVDDGTTGRYGTEIDLRNELEAYIATQKTRDGVNTMIVCVIVQGGPGSLKTVAGSIENNTPVVIVGGSGGWANILASVTNMNVDTVDKEDIKDLLLEHSVEINPDKLEEWTSMVNVCLSKRDHLTVFELDPNDTTRDLDIAILEALLKASTTDDRQAFEQLKLAMAWNRSDIAKSHILNDDVSIGKEDITNLFFSALLANKHKFCEVFLDFGVDLKDYMTVGILENLYKSVPKDSVVYKKLNKDCSLVRVGRVMVEYLGRSYISIYKKRNSKKSQKYCAVMHDEKDTTKVEWLSSPWNRDSKLDDPYREIFQWAILFNYREIARAIWNYMFESLPAAIMATKILKETAKKMTHNHECQALMLDDADEYENLAAGILGKCFSDNPDKAIPLLIRRLHKWGGYTTLHVAIEANDKFFVSRPCVQHFLDEVWRSKIADKTWTIHILFAAFVPPLIFTTIKFIDSEDENQDVKVIESSNVPNGNTHQNDVEMGPVAPTSKDEDVSDGADFLGFNSPEVDIGPRDKPFTPLEKLVAFYDAPIVTFWLNVVSFVLYLILFAFIVLSNFQISFVTISAFEYVLLGWTSTFLLEEIRELADQEAIHLKEKILLHIKDAWNIMDLISLALFYIAFGLRWYSQYLSVSLNLYSLAFMIQCIRIVHIFAVHSVLGPKIIMVGKMLKDLLFFLFILVVFLLAYGVASQALLYPGETNFGEIIVGIFYRPYWQIYGELFLDEVNYNPNLDAFECSDTDVNLPRCPQQSTVVPLISAVYLLFANVLLLNLLIAMFSYTFENVERHSNEIWMFQRYKLITDYYFRPPLVPPLIIISHIYLFSCFIKRKISNRQRDEPLYHALKINLQEVEIKQLRKWEHWHAESFLREKQEEGNAKVDRQLEKLNNRIDNITSTIEDLQEHSKGPSQEGSGMKTFQMSMLKKFQVLEDMIKSMDASHRGTTTRPPTQKPTAPIEPPAKKTEAPSLSLKPKPSPQVPKKEIPPDEYHKKARSSPYPDTKLKRTSVPDEKVSWSVEWPEYKPIPYNAPVVASIPPPTWADEDLEAYTDKSRPRLPFNKYDLVNKVNRASHIGSYLVVEGLPRNPKGRTGLQGRGLLGRYGPNHAADPVVTRWKRGPNRQVIHISGKPVLEFAAIKRVDTGEWAIPGGMVDPGEKVSATLKREFSEEALNIDGTDDETEIAKIKENVQLLFKSGGLELFRGYCDDYRNTDYAWIETVACNFHDEDGTAFDNIQLNPGDEANKASWRQVDRNLKLFASHFDILRKAAEMHNAYF